MFTGIGDFNEEGTVLTLEGKMDDPATGEMDKTIRYIARLTDKDKWIFEMHDLSIPADNKKTGEITYTRKK